MEEEQFVFPNFDETPQSCQGLPTNSFIDREYLNIPETISEQSSLSSNDDNLRANGINFDPILLIEHFSSDNKENIAISNSVVSDESTVCALKTFNYSNTMKCEKKLLENSNDEEISFKGEKNPKDSKKCLKLSKQLKFLSDSISTPPSVLREQISMLRKEMNEAYEFHDLEIKILNEEREDPQNYAELIEKYTTLLELYSSLKSEYEEYRRDQEKLKYELQSKTVNCLESLCSQIETSDNSLSGTSFISFNTDLKCSTMIGNFTENEATLLHDITIQTKDPLSDTNIFKSPELSLKKINYKKQCEELEDANSNLLAIISSKDAILKECESLKDSYENECEKLKQEAIKNESIIRNLKIEMDLMKEKHDEEIKKMEVDLQIAMTAKEIILKELEYLKPFQKDYEQMKALLKEKEDLISTLQFQLQSVRNNYDEEMQKMICEKQEFEVLFMTLKNENDTLFSSIATKDAVIKDLEVFKSSYENEFLKLKIEKIENEDIIRSLKAELDTVKEKYNEELKKAELDLQATIVAKESIVQELERLKCFNKTYEETKPQIEEREKAITNLQTQLLTLKNNYDEEVEKIRKEKIESEKLCFELENKITILLSVITTKNSGIEDLERLKSLREEECENVKVQLREKDEILLNLKVELDSVKEKYSEELRKTEADLQATISAKETISQEVEHLKSFQKNYEEIKPQLIEKDERISNLEVELISVKKTYDEVVERVKTEKEELEELCMKLKGENDSLLTVITTKDALIEDLEVFKSSLENECEKLKDEIMKGEEYVSNLKAEMDLMKEKYSEDTKKAEADLQAIMASKETIIKESEHFKVCQKEYEEMKLKMKKKEDTIASLQSDLLAMKNNWNEEVKIINCQKQELEGFFMDLKDKNSTLLSVMTTKDTIIKDLEAFKSLHEEECENVKVQLREKDEILLNLKVELDSVKEKYSEELRKTEADLQATISAKETISQEVEHLKSFQKNYEEIKPQLIEKDERISNLEVELISVKKTYDEVVERVKNEKEELEELCMKLKGENDSLLTVITTKDALIEDLEVFKSSLENECEKLKDEILKGEEYVSNLKAEMDLMKEKYSEDTRKAEADLQAIIASKETIIKELEHCKGYQKNYEEMKLQKEETENMIYNLQTELLLIKKNHDEVVERVKNEKEELEELCMKLKGENDSLLTVITTKDAIIEDLEVFKSSLENECEKLKDEIMKGEEYVSNLKAEMNLMKEKYSEDTKKAEADLQAIIASKETIIKELEHCKGYQKNYEEMKLQKEETENMIYNLQTELLLIKKNHDEVVERVKNEKEELEELCMKLKGENDSLLTVITTKDALIEDLEVFKSSLENECEKLKNEIMKGEECVSNLKAEMDLMKGKHTEEIKKVAAELKNAVEAKETVLRDLEYLINFRKEYEQAKPLLKEKEEKILKLEADLLSIKQKFEEEIQDVANRKVELEKLCMSLEDKNSSLLTVITSKDSVLKELEVFKLLHEKECEIVKQQLVEKENIVLNLRAEIDTTKEKYREEIKKTETDNILTFLQVSCEKLRNILGSKKCSDVQNIDLLKFISVDTEIEDRVLSEFMSAVFDVRNKLLHEWEIQKNNDYLLIKELKNKISKLERTGAEFDSFEQDFDLQRKDLEEKNLIHELAGLEKIKLSSVKEFPKVMKKVFGLVKKFQSTAAELKEENEKLDEECDSYAKVIKDLKKEAALEWKKNKEKTQVLEAEISRLTEMKRELEEEKKRLLGKISKLEEECQKLKANIPREERTCGCGTDLKKVNELKRIILVKEQRLLEFQDLEVQTNSYKSQIEYLKNALDKERKKINEEREKNKKLQNDLNEATQNQKTDKKFEENEILEELRMRGSISGGVVQEIVDKEKMRKLSKDVGVLKEICRARYAEIKRLEAENAALKKNTPKNSNQMDSPIRSRGYKTRSKSSAAEKWSTDVMGKENKVL